MSEQAAASAPTKTPWHLWTVGILTLLWDGSGALTIWLAQAGKLPDINADEAEYYAAQALWFQLLTDVTLVTALLAAVALMMKKKAAVGLFGASLVSVSITNLYDVAMGTSRVFFSTGAFVVTVIILVLAMLQLWYANEMTKRGLLS